MEKVRRLRRPRPTVISHTDLRALRKSAGISQGKAALMFGISRVTITNWEAGRHPAPKWIVILYRLLAAKRQALITGQAPTVEL